MTKKVPVMSHNLKGFNNHLIIREIGKLDVKVNVIPDGLENWMIFKSNKNLVLLTACNFWVLVWCIG